MRYESCKFRRTFFNNMFHLLHYVAPKEHTGRGHDRQTDNDDDDDDDDDDDHDDYNDNR